MNSALAELKQRLGPLLGSRVTRMVLLVWPDEDNNIETDIRVNFTLERLDGKVVSYSFFIAADGQTPVVSMEEVRVDCSLAALQQRKLVWQARDFWIHSTSIGYEHFLVQPATDFGSIVGANLTRIDIICFQDELVVTGLAFHFSGGDVVYCIPGMTKGTILTYLPVHWFPAPLESVSV